VLVFTNRQVLSASSDESAFTAKFVPGSNDLGMAQVTRARSHAGAHWSLSDVTATVNDATAQAALVNVFEGSRPVLVHIHGNSMAPDACFERCTRFEEVFDVAVVGFSWPSEGRLPSGKRRAGVTGVRAEAEDRWTLAAVTSANFAKGGGVGDVIARYRQSKRNGTKSVVALARFLELVGKAQGMAHAPQRFTIAAHSLGVHCLQMLLKAGLGASLPRARNIALLAACVPNRNHARWVIQLPRSGGLMITTNISDWVLLGALYADNFQAKLGASIPAPPLVVDPKTRYVDFLHRSAGEHEYFIAEQGKTLDPDLLALFKRFFGSGDDIAAGQDPCDVYRGCCDGVPLVCDVS
jgi:hypothetical protein